MCDTLRYLQAATLWTIVFKLDTCYDCGVSVVCGPRGPPVVLPSQDSVFLPMYSTGSFFF